MPSKTCDSCITVFALGGIISSPGVPNTVTVPGVCVFVRYSAIATAAARPIGPCVLCWSPWKAPLVPRSASYSTMTPRLGPPVLFVVARDEGGRQPGVPIFTVKSCLLEIVGEDLHRALLLEPISGWRVMSSPMREQLGVHQLLGARDDLIARGVRRP